MDSIISVCLSISHHAMLLYVGIPTLYRPEKIGKLLYKLLLNVKTTNKIVILGNQWINFAL